MKSIKKRVNFILIIIFSISFLSETISITAKAAVLSAPSDAFQVAGHYYKIIPETITWEEAKKKCQKMGGHLATITCPKEQQLIESLNISGRRLWIGATRDEYFNWSWVTGEVWGYTNWDAGEPNNMGNEKYASIWSQKWNDLKNDSNEQSGYICEWDNGTSFVWNKIYPVDAIAFRGNYYKIISERTSWSEANSMCKAKGGHLVTITSAKEQKFIESINIERKKLWIGGYRDSYHNWYWVTGEKWGYKHWKSGEPNNMGNEKYASIWPQKWNDLKNDSYEQSGYICEWEGNGSGIKNSAPKKTKITFARGTSKVITVKFKKVNSVGGYIVECSPSKTFSKSRKKITLNNAKKTTAKIRKVKKGRNYYIRVRSYVKNKNNTTYSPWSAVKKVTIRK